MRKALTAAMAAITLAGTVCATAAPAAAHDWDHRYYGDRHDRRNNDGAAVAAGVIGLALGAALASNNSHSYSDRGYSDRSYSDRGYDDRGYYNRGYYNRGYYNRGYYAAPAYSYGYGYRTCETTRWVWDPYIGRRVAVESRYAC